mmetsp:Transcript_25865/g.41492  ORF Transcript_25865/g.41492 Transcript_25865/m.41492 type:complete len:708 (-) Transcript_25865:104-2227(-)
MAPKGWRKSAQAKTAAKNKANAGADAEPSKKRSRDVPAQAARAVKNQLTEEQRQFVAMLEVDDKSFQKHVEEEILRQGGYNFELKPPFWQDLYVKFGISHNPVSSLAEIAEGGLPTALAEALELCKSTNPCTRGRGLLQLTSVLAMENDKLPDAALYTLAEKSFGMVTQSRYFIDQMQYQVCKYMVDKDVALDHPDLWEAVHADYQDALARLYAKQDAKRAGGQMSFVMENQKILAKYMNMDHVQKIMASKNDCADCITEVFSVVSSGPLGKAIFEQEKIKADIANWNRAIDTQLATFISSPDIGKVVAYEDMKVTCKSLTETAFLGSTWWSKKELFLKVDFMQATGIDVPYHDRNMKWRYPSSAAMKESWLLEGHVPGLPYEKILLDLPNVADVSDESVTRLALYKETLVARQYLLDQLSPLGSMALHNYRKEVLRHDRILCQKDPTWPVQREWVVQRAPALLAGQCHNQMLAALPDVKAHVTVSKALQRLVDFEKSALCGLAQNTAVIEELQNLKKQIAGIPSGMPLPPLSDKTSEFYRMVNSRLVLFCETEIPKVGLGGKLGAATKVSGKEALAYEVVAIKHAVSKGQTYPTAKLIMMRAFKNLIDAADWENIRTAMQISMPKKGPEALLVPITDKSTDAVESDTDFSATACASNSIYVESKGTPFPAIVPATPQKKEVKKPSQVEAQPASVVKILQAKKKKFG